MKTSLFDYELPRELIAAVPCEPRDESRLLVLRRSDESIEHRMFRDLPEYLASGDVMVMNDSRVLRARLHGKRMSTGGTVEFLLLERTRPMLAGERDRWNVLCRPARKLKPGEVVYFANKQLTATVLHYTGEGEREVEFSCMDVEPWLEKLGEVPLPPYIVQRRRELSAENRPAPTVDDAVRYQTVYAAEGGSVAAPTAGLHFTPQLLEGLAGRGVRQTRITLHVGLGTFKPVEVEDTEAHLMHEERFCVSEAAAAEVNAGLDRGGRIVAVGTTSVRTLESAADEIGRIAAGTYKTRLMIVPGYQFKMTDVLITNFHLPRSTLLMLVSAFAGREFVLRAYEDAVRWRYRFFSYGDAMLIL